MSRDYYLVIDEEREGPFTRRQISERIRAGELEGEILAWFRGSDGWSSLRELPEFVGMEAEEELTEEEEQALAASAGQRGGGVAIEEHHAATSPWLRLGARLVDVIVLSAFAGLLLGVIPIPMSNGGIVMRYVLHLLMMMSGEALLLSWVGTTPGKSLFGLVVRRESGGLLRFGEAFMRTAYLYLLGLGLLIPPFIFIGLAVSYFLLKSRGRLPWDRGLGADVFAGPRAPWKVGLGIFILTSYIFATLMFTVAIFNAVKKGDFESLPPGSQDLLKQLGYPVGDGEAAPEGEGAEEPSETPAEAEEAEEEVRLREDVA